VDFRKLLKLFIASGGEVIVSSKWAEEFGVQPGGAIGGVQFKTQDEIANIVIDSDKIVDYATPNYPFNMMLYHQAGPR
jgi:hypothetical protein